jgi:hypothetical protein
MIKINKLALAGVVLAILVFAIRYKGFVSENKFKEEKWNEFLDSFHSFQMRHPGLIESVEYINGNKSLQESQIVPYISIGMEQNGLQIFLNNWEYDDYCYYFDSNYVFKRSYRILKE